MAQTPQQAAQAIADATGYVPSPLTPEQIAIRDLYSKPLPISNPPDPQVPAPTKPLSEEQIQAQDNPVNPTTNSAGTDPAVPASQIDTSATPTNFGTSTQTFDDGSTIQTFDDGSTLATGTDGSVSSSPAPVDPATDPAAGEVGSNQAGPPVSLADPANLAAAKTTVGAAQAGDQPKVAELQFAANTDWRVTLRLAPGAT